jgi:hypothetical protein
MAGIPTWEGTTRGPSYLFQVDFLRDKQAEGYVAKIALTSLWQQSLGGPPPEQREHTEELRDTDLQRLRERTTQYLEECGGRIIECTERPGPTQ